MTHVQSCCFSYKTYWILKSLLGSLNSDDGFFDVLVADVGSQAKGS